MHILLTDVLSCPRCGPEFGLILLADELAERRIREGRLGCANCREAYPIHQGVPDLRSPPGDAFSSEAAAQDASVDPARTEEEAFRLAALLGIAEGPALVLTAGLPPRLSAALTDILIHAEIVSVLSVPLRLPSGGRANYLVSGARLPFKNGVARGVVVRGGADTPPLVEAVRVLRRGGRLVIEASEPHTGDALRELGMTLLLDQDDTVVALLPGAA